MTDIIIDHRIRDWVFVPLVVVMFLVSVFSFYLQQYMRFKTIPEKVTSSLQVAEIIDKSKFINIEGTSSKEPKP